MHQTSNFELCTYNPILKKLGQVLEEVFNLILYFMGKFKKITSEMIIHKLCMGIGPDKGP